MIPGLFEYIWQTLSESQSLLYEKITFPSCSFQSYVYRYLDHKMGQIGWP